MTVIYRKINYRKIADFFIMLNLSKNFEAVQKLGDQAYQFQQRTHTNALIIFHYY